jgi:hypothetical protein
MTGRLTPFLDELRACNANGHTRKATGARKKCLAQMPTGTRKRCAKMALAMVKENREAITDVAAELVIVQKISGERLKEILKMRYTAS